jgi:Hemerythrin HHE cation binding domain
MADITDLIFDDHHWFRRQFFYLDEAANVDELRAIWEPLATRLDTHADAEERIFYPALLKKGDADEAAPETEDAIGDHNKIRDAVAESRRHPVGSEAWRQAVAAARQENGEHLEEEEREGLPDFRRNAPASLKHSLAMDWLRFTYDHPLGRGVDERDKDPDAYIEENS